MKTYSHNTDITYFQFKTFVSHFFHYLDPLYEWFNIVWIFKKCSIYRKIESVMIPKSVGWSAFLRNIVSLTKKWRKKNELRKYQGKYNN